MLEGKFKRRHKTNMEDKMLNITNVIGNNDLRGSLYSTFKCSVCGEKLIAQVVGDKLQFACKDYKYSYGDPSRKEHDAFTLTLEEIAAIFNFNPLL